jgi:hypothetical protein
MSFDALDARTRYYTAYIRSRLLGCICSAALQATGGQEEILSSQKLLVN